MTRTNLVPRVFSRPQARERPWERGCMWQAKFYALRRSKKMSVACEQDKPTSCYPRRQEEPGNLVHFIGQFYSRKSKLSQCKRETQSLLSGHELHSFSNTSGTWKFFESQTLQPEFQPSFFTIKAHILARSLANFYRHLADRHMNL